MAAFAYTAINAQGFLADGEIHAPTLDAAREQLRIRGLLAEKLEELPSAGEDGVRTAFKKIKPKSLQIFSRQFATMIEAGLSVVAALVILEGKTDDKYLAQIIGKLPTLTQWVVDASNFIKADWYLILIFSVGGTFSFKKWRKTAHGQRNWDRFKLRLPMKIGDVVLKITMARFSRTFSTLVAAGVDIIGAIDITSQTAGNWVVEKALIDAKHRVHEGVPISQPLVVNPVFPPMVSQMIKVGEETGELDKMLGKIADVYEEEVDASIETLTSII